MKLKEIEREINEGFFKVGVEVCDLKPLDDNQLKLIKLIIQQIFDKRVAELQEKSKDYCFICNKMNKCFGKGFCPFLKLFDDIDVLFGCEKSTDAKEVKER